MRFTRREIPASIATVAIKVLPAHIAAAPALRERFEREARTISSLDHPHICALYDVGEHQALRFS